MQGGAQDDTDLLARIKRLRSLGATEEEVAAFVDEHDGVAKPAEPAKPGLAGYGKLRDLGREFWAGLLPGVSARLEAGARALGPETYKDALEQIKSERRDFQGKHPWQSLAASAAGGVPIALATAGASAAPQAARGATLLSRAGSSMKAGAKAGALFGAAEGSYEGVPGALQGAAVGGVAGGLLSPLAMGVGAGASKAKALAERYLGGQPTATQALGRSGGAQELLERWAENRDVDPDDLVKTLQRATGATSPDDPRIVADLAPEAGRLLRGAGLQNPTVSRAVQNKVVKGRSAKTATRVLDRMAKELGITPEDALAKADDILAARSANAAKNYAPAMAAGEMTDPAVLKAYAEMQEAFPEALAAGRESQDLAYRAAGRELPKRGAGTNAELIASAKAQGFSDDVIAMMGLTDDAPKPTIEDLHYFKQGVDRTIKARQRAADNKVPLAGGDVKNAGEMQRQFLEALDKAVPEYGTARKQFADESRLAEALEAGREAFKSAKTTGRDVSRAMAELSDAEREMFRVGAFDAAREVANTSGVGDEGLRALFGVKLGTGTIQRPDRLEKMRALFADGRRFGDFDQYLRQEIAGAETASLAGNSQTAEKLSDAAQSEFSAPGAAGVVQGMPGRAAADEVVAALRRKLRRGVTQRAGEQGQILLKSAGGADIVEILTEMAKERARRTAAQRTSRVTAPALQGLLTGLTAGREVR